MPMLLKGSCRCGAVGFQVESHTPVPFMLCYCSICRKQQGGGGYAINLGADSATLKIEGEENLGLYRAEIEDDERTRCEVSTGERRFCTKCGSALWLYDPTWPELVHPFASAIDSELPKAPERVHIMLKYKASWVEPNIRDGDRTFDSIRRSRSPTGTRSAGFGWIESTADLIRCRAIWQPSAESGLSLSRHAGLRTEGGPFHAE